MIKIVKILDKMIPLKNTAHFLLEQRALAGLYGKIRLVIFMVLIN